MANRLYRHGMEICRRAFPTYVGGSANPESVRVIAAREGYRAPDIFKVKQRRTRILMCALRPTAPKFAPMGPLGPTDWRIRKGTRSYMGSGVRRAFSAEIDAASIDRRKTLRPSGGRPSTRRTAPPPRRRHPARFGRSPRRNARLLALGGRRGSSAGVGGASEAWLPFSAHFRVRFCQ